MKDELISYETAILAKEKGFIEPCLYAYNHLEDGHRLNGVLFRQDRAINVAFGEEDCNIENAPFVSAPTQSLLQRWLRETRDIHVNIEYWNGANYNYKYKIVYQDEYRKTIHGDYLNSYEDCLEEGLKEALKLIIHPI